MESELKVEQVPIEQLKPADYNPRKWSAQARKGLSDSLDQFGFVQPLVVNSAPERRGVIIGGNFKLDIARQRGLKTLPVVWVNLPDIEKEKNLNIRLNKNQGEFDLDLLADFDPAMLADIGFDSKELDKIFEEEGEDDFDAEKEVAAIVTPTAKLGDVFQIGMHRLMCGDSTDPQHIGKLMDGKTADMVFMDPPYGVSYTGGTKEKLKIENDDLDATQLQAFLEKAFSAVFVNLKRGGSWYVAGPAGQPFNMAFNRGLEPYGWRHTLVWVKNTFVLGRADYHYRHELLFYGWKEGAGHYFTDGRTESTVFEKEPTDEELAKWARTQLEKHGDIWHIKKPARNGEHPTMKPIELVEKAIRNSSRREEIVLDAFLGSAATMVAAHGCARICYGMEFDPRYADVGVRRMLKLDPTLALTLNGEVVDKTPWLK